MRPTRVEIDLAAIRHNISQIKTHIGAAPKLMAVVKANAYGHGAQKVSQAALQAGATCLAVSLPEEAIELRAAGITVPILSLGLVLPEQANLILNNNLIATISTMDSINALAAVAQEHFSRIQVFLKVDSGMGRIGINLDQIADFLEAINKRPSLELIGIFTHLATADACSKTYADTQLDRFRNSLTIDHRLTTLPYISAANSATAIDLPHGHFNTVRAGIAIYGLPPSAEIHNKLDLRPAMALKSKIIYIKQVPAGTSISYGCTYTTEHQTFIATLPLGYADGYSRLLSNKAQVLINGRRRPIVGRVCMDQLMVDLGPVCDAAVGDEAVLFGRQGNEEITVTELADIIGTINYELVCGISLRVPRIYLNDES
jgi:alanine racemase